MKCEVLAPLYGLSLGSLVAIWLSFNSFVPCGVSGDRPWLFLWSLICRSVVALIGVRLLREEQLLNKMTIGAVALTFGSLAMDIHASDCSSGCFEFDLMSDGHIKDKLFPGQTPSDQDLGLLQNGGWRTYLYVRDNWCDSTLIDMIGVSSTMTSVASCVVCDTDFGLHAFSYHNVSLAGNLLMLLFLYLAWSDKNEGAAAHRGDGLTKNALTTMEGMAVAQETAKLPAGGKQVPPPPENAEVTGVFPTAPPPAGGYRPLLPVLRQRSKSGRIQF